MDQAHMANTAMFFLADADARIEVRTEAARTLGLMQSRGRARLNFSLVAYVAAQLAADLASQFNDQYPEKPKPSDNSSSRGSFRPYYWGRSTSPSKAFPARTTPGSCR